MILGFLFSLEADPHGEGEQPYADDSYGDLSYGVHGSFFPSGMSL
jgi:hypothetical protein